MAPHHLLMVTMTSGRRKEIITTEGVGEEGHVDEEGEAVVATMEVGGAVATVMIMAMAREAGTMKSKMNTMMSPKNMPLPLAVVSPRLMTLHVDVDFALHSRLMVCGLLFYRAWQRKKGDALARAWWAWATARRPRRLLLDKKCDVPNGCAEARNGVLRYLLAFAQCSSMKLRPRTGIIP